MLLSKKFKQFIKTNNLPNTLESFDLFDLRFCNICGSKFQYKQHKIDFNSVCPICDQDFTIFTLEEIYNTNLNHSYINK